MTLASSWAALKWSPHFTSHEKTNMALTFRSVEYNHLLSCRPASNKTFWCSTFVRYVHLKIWKKLIKFDWSQIFRRYRKKCTSVLQSMWLKKQASLLTLSVVLSLTFGISCGIFSVFDNTMFTCYNCIVIHFNTFDISYSLEALQNVREVNWGCYM